MGTATLIARTAATNGRSLFSDAGRVVVEEALRSCLRWIASGQMAKSSVEAESVAWCFRHWRLELIRERGNRVPAPCLQALEQIGIRLDAATRSDPCWSTIESLAESALSECAWRRDDMAIEVEQLITQTYGPSEQ